MAVRARAACGPDAEPELERNLARATGLEPATSGVTGRTANAVFGSPDDMKFQSSMTLFGRAAPSEAQFRKALARYYDGQEDVRTVEKLK